MSSSEVTKQSQDQQVSSQQQQPEALTETKESHKTASANAGVNLSLGGIVSGIFGSSTKTETDAEGNSTQTREERAAVKGSGQGDLNAQGAAHLDEGSREAKGVMKQ